MLGGGSWYSGARLIRSAFRRWDIPDYRSDAIEFSVARDFLLDRRGASIIDVNRG